MNNLKNIYNFEVTPPQGAWDHIAKELDNADQYKGLSQNLTSLEIPPPAHIWANITHQLDEADREAGLSGKLYQTEIAPPAGMWSAISNELDDQQALEIIASKLSNLQVRPPSTTWTYIKDVLEEKQKAPALVVPINHNRWLKYAAAACFIAVISITGYFIFEDNGSGTSISTATNNSPNTGAVIQQASAGTNNPSDPDLQGQATSKDQAMAGIRTKLGNAYTLSNERNSELQDRYIILMTQEGNVVRMSKKVGNMADCIAGEDHSCDDQILKWQKEMANSTATSTPGNFLDILDIASQEGQDSNSKPRM
ncbi:MAG: hypothetical protein QM640_07005 [Niabella sp.]